jgi:membrane protein insertase Oxa1/YidC/SpoIIIJ
LLLLFQTPVMMGLYFCLQESIFFRLDHFLWINNMAAPDMTLWWTEKIPYISTPDDMGSFFYLGPYLNILPLLAVGLMIWQQNKMMPPPTDEQMAQQQKMMKFMMIFIALMFYKVAAGLALYFIVGSAWGLIERRYFTKKKEHDDEAAAEAAALAGPTPLLPSQNGQGASNEPEKPKGALGRFRAALNERMEELKRQAEEQSKRQIRNTPDQKGRDKKRKKRK